MRGMRKACLSSLVAEFVSQLADGGGLATTIDSHYEEHCWLVIKLKLTALSLDLQYRHNAFLQAYPASAVHDSDASQKNDSCAYLMQAPRLHTEMLPFPLTCSTAKMHSFSRILEKHCPYSDASYVIWECYALLFLAKTPLDVIGAVTSTASQ